MVHKVIASICKKLRSMIFFCCAIYWAVVHRKNSFSKEKDYVKCSLRKIVYFKIIYLSFSLKMDALLFSLQKMASYHI